jgi:2-polyprenyl-3-methyl-5-hydroxy-6-metoxy-1,4-benzoquinol methylase
LRCSDCGGLCANNVEDLPKYYPRILFKQFRPLDDVGCGLRRRLRTSVYVQYLVLTRLDLGCSAWVPIISPFHGGGFMTPGLTHSAILDIGCGGGLCDLCATLFRF